MTTAARPLPDHGTLSRAKYHKCPCSECRAADTAYQRNRHRKRGYGTWQPYVDAEPVRQHLAMLREHGISYIRAAELAGMYVPTVGRLIYTVSGRKPVKRVRPETAAALLAVQPGDIEPVRSDATGTRRRIQALAAHGWPLRNLGPLLGLNPSTPGRLLGQESLLTTTAKAVAEGYERLSRMRPEETGVASWLVVKTRKWAASQGWHDPLFWEDMGAIDDSGFNPEDLARPLGRNELAAQRRDEVWLFHTAGFSDDEIAVRVGLAASTVHAIRDEFRTGRKRKRTVKPVAA